MKGKLFFLLKYYLYWIVLSVLARVCFLLYQWQDTLQLGCRDVIMILYRGLQLDLSLGGYILMLSAVIMMFSSFFSAGVLRRLFSVLTVVLLVFFSVVVTADLELFRNWGYHIDSTPLMYLKTPKNILASTPLWLNICLILLAVAFFWGGWLFFRKIVNTPFKYEKRVYWEIPIFLLLGAAMLIPVRGGFNVAPMNSSFVFFHSSNMYANQAAINPVWNFVYELMHMKKLECRYRFMPEEEASEIVGESVRTGDDFPRLLKTERPNIVFLLLESFTANAIESLGGIPGVTPELDSLAGEGVLFTDIYATGSRSDRGMVAAISGLPSNPSYSLIKYPDRLMKFSRFPKDLEKVGYSTRYYYAGDINFGCFRSYVTMSFQSMVTEDDFSGEAIANRFKWGVHDEYMFERLYEDLLEAPQPFMYMAFNMSSHEPFTVPGEVKIPGNDQEHLFLNAIHYSDRCIGDFIRNCKASGIWDNTLFILMADHGTRVIRHVDPSLPEAYHIPLLLTGGALNVRDTTIDVTGSQTDMIATVMAQMGLDYSGYRYSRNLLAGPVFPFAFYSYSNAAGIVSEAGTTVMNLQSRQWIKGDTLERNKRTLQAYLQNITTEMSR